MAESDTKEKRVRKPRAVKTIEVDKDVVKEKPAPAKEKAPTKTRTRKTAPTPDSKETSTKLSKEEAAKKVSEAKELSDLIQTLKDKNTPGNEKAAVKMARDTIKLVTEAQKSGSLAFKRESTKALVQIRNAIEKIPFVKDEAKDKLVADIDSVVLDVKNVTLYMKSLAKAQIKLMEEKAKEDIKAIKTDAQNKARLLRSEALSESKKIKKQTHDEMKAQAERQAIALSTERQEQAIRIKGLKQSLHDRAEDVKNKQKDRELDYEKKVADQKASIKQQRADSAAQAKKIRGDLIQRRQKQNDDIKLRKLEVKQEIAKGQADIREMKKMTKLKMDQLVKDFKEEQKEKKLKKAKDERSKFLGSVMEGVHDANPLLALAINVGKGVKSLIDIRKEKKESQQRKHNITKQFTGSKLGNRTFGLQSSKVSSSSMSGGAHAGGIAPTSGGAGDSDGVLGGIIGSVMSVVSGVGSFLGGIAKFGGKLLPIIGKGARAIPVIGIFATAIMTIFDFVEGFSNAGKLFGEEDPSTFKKMFSGFVNVFSSILGIVDDVAGWLGFDTKLKDGFEKGAVDLYKGVASFFTGLVDTVSKWFEDFDLTKILISAGETIVDAAKMLMNALLAPYRWLADKFAGLLTKIPGIGDDNIIVKTLKEFGSGGKAKTDNISSKPSSASSDITTSQKTVDDLKDKVDTKKAGGNTTAIVDNSTKSSNTTIVSQKLSTRNDDSSSARFGYPNAFGMM